MRVAYWMAGCVSLLILVAAIGYAVGNQYISVTGPFQVTCETNVSHWEPATAVGATWVHAYEDFWNKIAHTAAWTSGCTSGTNWADSGPINAPDGTGVGDVYTAFDGTRNQYVLSATGFQQYSSSAYFATSTDGLHWTTLQSVLPGQTFGGAFDYSSVAVDSTGRIAVGAVLYQNNQDTAHSWGFYVNTSIDGGNTWSGPTQVIAPPGPQVASQTNPADISRWGINARIVAAGNHFHIFLPSLKSGSMFQPLAVWRYDENNGSWSGWNSVLDFSDNPPQNNSPVVPPQSPYYIYYAPLIDASGNSSGTWAVTFQEQNGGYNNLWMCTSGGCYHVNPYSLDQFMNGVSVGPEGGVWVSYVGYSGNNYQLPLYHQAIYFPPPGTLCNGYIACGATGDSGVDPTSWVALATADRCGISTTCLAMGDYARIGSNGYLAIDAPYVKYTAGNISTQLFQAFYSDPQGTPPANNFTPHPVFYALGSQCTSPALPTRHKRWGFRQKSDGSYRD